MKDVNDYVTGKVVKDTKLGFFLLKFVNLPLIGSSVRNRMINGTKKYAPKNKAINTLRNYSKKHAMILSTVDKKPMEICCSSKETCIYWNMERNGLRCVNCIQSG